MNFFKILLSAGFLSFLILGCDKSTSDELINSRDPYPEYSLLGNIPDVDPYAIQDHDGSVETNGNNRADLNDLKATSVSATLSDYDKLEEAGIKYITIDVGTGHDDPKFTTGAFVLKPFAVYSGQTTQQTTLPEVLVFLSDFDSSSTIDAVFQPDVDSFMNNPFSNPDDYPPYIIEAASLNISYVEDIELDESEKREQLALAQLGIISGKQYVKGTISFTIKKFGPNGANFGPETFTFASVNDWAYTPNIE